MTNTFFEDVWQVLREATDKGWIDPGLTEPIDVTAKRARKYLNDLNT